MKRWITILTLLPIMFALSQCSYGPYNSDYVDGHVTGYVEGFVYDASDRCLLSNVHVEIRIQEHVRRRPRRGPRVILPAPRHPYRGSNSYHHKMVFDVYTDDEGFFAYEFPLYDRYSYSLLLSAGDYYARRVRIDNPCGQYLEIGLVPH